MKHEVFCTSSMHPLLHDILLLSSSTRLLHHWWVVDTLEGLKISEAEGILIRNRLID